MQIAAYSFEWDFKNNKGIVYLRNSEGQKAQVSVDSLEEFAAMSYILRNSKTVFYHADKSSITMEWTPTGS
jgi:flagellar hook assembly protein FlgD